MAGIAGSLERVIGVEFGEVVGAANGESCSHEKELRFYSWYHRKPLNLKCFAF